MLRDQRPGAIGIRICVEGVIIPELLGRGARTAVSDEIVYSERKLVAGDVAAAAVVAVSSARFEGLIIVVGAAR